MPWLSEAMKDVTSCDKLGEVQITFDPEISEWGNLACWRHVALAPTQGTETSKYLEEKKTIVIPQVVASERGSAQTDIVTAISGL